MFTGIVEELGRFVEREGDRFTFAASPVVIEDARVGGSIAVNGCCLTVVGRTEELWQADVVDETLIRTNLGDLRPGDPVNLERPLRLSDRLDGHLVQGHVDGVGEVVVAGLRGPNAAAGLRGPNAASGSLLSVRAPAALLRYLAEKGSVAVDGVSLTIARVEETGFTVALIPHTAEVTTLGRRRPGDRVNLEVDLVARYVARLLGE